MRILIARLNHETNTFSPVKTDLASFNPHWNDDAKKFAAESNTALGAFYAYAKSKQAELIVPLAATANPSGPVEDAAFEQMSEAIVEAAKQSCDLILLDLHGAMVTQSHDDGEGELLARIRAVAPSIPIGVALDLHGNITQRMLDNCDCLVGFKTYPHIDMYATGEHVTRIIDEILNTGVKPAQAWVHPPMLAATLKMNTNEGGAMTDIVNLARAAEKREGVYAVTFFGGFPIADLAETGVSVVTAAKTPSLAETVSREIAEEVWKRRSEFLYEEEALSSSIEKAHVAHQSADGRYVLMLDHGDNCMSGGSCDNMDVLDAALKFGLNNIVVGPICDPDVVHQMTEAGMGQKINIQLGNKVIADDFVTPQPPLQLEGIVDGLSDGDYVVSGPIYTGQLCRMGRTAVLRTERATILITEKPHEPWDLGVFNCAGIDPFKADYLILKSRMYCRPVFEPNSAAVIECASSGVTSSDYELFSFKKLIRPVYPLDNNVVW